MHHFKASLQLKNNAKPLFCKHRPVPFVLKESIGKEFDRLKKDGILKKVNNSVWAAPLVPVPKSDGQIRLCGDYKATVNQSFQVDQYPLPKPDDLFALLAGGQKFSKLDMSQAYQHMQLDKQSQPYMCMLPSTPIRASTAVLGYPFYYCFCASHFSAYDGHHFAGNTPCSVLYLMTF